jgi:hypothetical protein
LSGAGRQHQRTSQQHAPLQTAVSKRVGEPLKWMIVLADTRRHGSAATSGSLLKVPGHGHVRHDVIS